MVYVTCEVNLMRLFQTGSKRKHHCTSLTSLERVQDLETCSLYSETTSLEKVSLWDEIHLYNKVNRGKHKLRLICLVNMLRNLPV